MPSDSEDLVDLFDDFDRDPGGDDMLDDINHALLNLGRARAHVSEVFSPPRVTKYAGRLGLSAGFSLDLIVVDPDDGKTWDFNDPAKRSKALSKVIFEKPHSNVFPRIPTHSHAFPGVY